MKVHADVIGHAEVTCRGDNSCDNAEIRVRAGGNVGVSFSDDYSGFAYSYCSTDIDVTAESGDVLIQ